MIEDLGECQNTGIHVTRIKTNGRTQYLTSRHHDALRKELAELAARYRLEQETEDYSGPGEEDGPWAPGWAERCASVGVAFPYLPGLGNAVEIIGEMIRNELNQG